MPPFARLLILREGKKHAAFSLAAPACPESLLRRETRQARGSLAEARWKPIPVLSHSERVDPWGRGGMPGRVWDPRPLVDLLAHTPSSPTRP